MSTWETTTLERIWGLEFESREEGSPEMMAAAVSSQEDSIARMFIIMIIQHLGCLSKAGLGFS